MSVIAADIGGTHIRVGRITPAGEIEARRNALTHPELGSGAAIEQLCRFVDELLSDAPTPLSRIGLAVTGPVDPATGIVDNPYTLHGWGPTDLITPLQERFGVRPHIENDANAAALGEWTYGAGRGSRRLAAVTVGTGIGVGLIVGGQVQRKSDGAHGEAGHHLLDPRGPQCYCGARGCWEVLAAGPALVRLAHQLASPCDERQTTAEQDRLTADAVLNQATAGEPAALEILHEIAIWIGRGLVNTIAFFMPDTIVIGGGIGARCFSILEPEMTAQLKRHARMVPTNIRLHVATTGDDAGLLGATRGAALV